MIAPLVTNETGVLRQTTLYPYSWALRYARGRMLDLRVEYAQSIRQEMGKLSFLTPVQRARLMIMRDHLLHRVHEMRDDRRAYRHHANED